MKAHTPVNGFKKTPCILYWWKWRSVATEFHLHRLPPQTQFLLWNLGSHHNHTWTWVLRGSRLPKENSKATFLVAKNFFLSSQWLPMGGEPGTSETLSKVYEKCPVDSGDRMVQIEWWLCGERWHTGWQESWMENGKALPIQHLNKAESLCLVMCWCL